MAIDNDMVVSIEYELKEKGGEEVIDTNIGGMPLEFIMGYGQIIPGLEVELATMEKGAKATVEVSAVDAYGEYNPSALQKQPIGNFGGIELSEGMTLYGQTETGQTVSVLVKEFDEKEVTIDYNHPLAGKDLSFAVEILEVREATPEEIQSGQPGAHLQGGDECCGTGTGGCGCGH